MTTAYELARCIVCGSADGTELASGDDIRREVEALWEYHGRRLRPETPPEHLMDRVAFSQHPPLRVVQCCECGMVYRNPIERPVELSEIYAEDAPTTQVLRALHETQRASYAAQASRLTEVVGRAGSGIEVGSYVGAFLAAARDAGWQFFGVDVNPCTNEFTRSLGFEVFDGTIEALDDTRRADAVAIWNCLDQLSAPAVALRAARRHLAPDGVLAVRVPNGACYAALRAHLDSPLGAVARTVLAENNLLTFPYRYGFTPGSLQRLFESCGYEVVATVGDVLVPIADEWTRPWAALSERVVKTLGHAVAQVTSGDRPLAPWFEMYGRVV